ncbi:hypothetical protein LBMAG20_00990 [Methylocystaceae bacterium]|nr:hypothetical protein LBMAG20_00990 [Methylocystaceae bacterium]
MGRTHERGRFGSKQPRAEKEGKEQETQPETGGVLETGTLPANRDACHAPTIVKAETSLRR